MKVENSEHIIRAQKEVELAKKSLVKNDIGNEHYDKVLEIFNNLADDIEYPGVVRCILNNVIRLMSNKPLTPITEEDDEWVRIGYFSELKCTIYHAKRLNALYKYEYTDGSIKYKDTARVQICSRYGVVLHGDENTYELFDLLKQYCGKILIPYYPLLAPYKFYIDFRSYKEHCDTAVVTKIEHGTMTFDEPIRVDRRKLCFKKDNGHWKEVVSHEELEERAGIFKKGEE